MGDDEQQDPEQLPVTSSSLAKYAAAKAAMGHVRKDRANPYFNSKYADLSQIKTVADSAFLPNGLVVIECVVGGEVLQSSVVDVERGEVVVMSEIPVLRKDSDDPQKFGAGLTYARRHNYCVIAGLAPDDDDDGNSAASPGPRAQTNRTVTKPAKEAVDGNKAHARHLYAQLSAATSADHAKSVVASLETDQDRIIALKKALAEQPKGETDG